MQLNNLGKIFRTNSVEVGEQEVKKRFNHFALAMLWGFLERKPLLSAKTRYEREKRMITKFADHPELNTPTLLDSDDEELLLIFKTLNLTDLVQVFQDPEIHPDDKLQYLRAALDQLHAIHDAGETHGDPYLKNFFEVNNPDGNNFLYTCDFEYGRTGPDPVITDVMILTANSIQALGRANGISPAAPLSLVREVYGNDTTFPFDRRDRFFFSKRFGVGTEFFKHFGK